MDQYNNRYSEGPQQNRHTNPYDSRTYYDGQGHGHRDYMPSGRGSYEPGDMETHWDRYNSANYGAQNKARNRVRNENPGADFAFDDYRYRSGNREWHLLQSPNPGRQERLDDRYNYRNRYAANQPMRRESDLFEWVGAGVSRVWDGITGHRPQEHDRDRDYDYHRSYRNENRSYGASEENMRAYGNRPLQGYERGHNFADDTPNSQQQIGDRTSPGNYNPESDFHRAGRNFDRDRDL